MKLIKISIVVLAISFMNTQYSFSSSCTPKPISESGIVKNISILGYNFDAPMTAAVSFNENLDGLNVLFWIRMEELRNIQKRIVEGSIPGSSCRHRYHNNADYNMTLTDGIINGSSSIRYEKWTCERVPYPCVRGWRPKICHKEVKTRIFTHVEHANFGVTSSLDAAREYIDVSITGRTSGTVSLRIDEYVNRNIYENVKNYMNLRSTSFRLNELGEIGLVLYAESKELSENQVCSIYTRLSEDKELKSAGNLGKVGLAVEALSE